MKHLIAVLMALVCAGLAQADEGLSPGAKVAFFGLSFIDTSTEGAVNGVRDDETARLEMLETYVRDEFTNRGFTLLPLDAVEVEMNRVASVADCNFCDVFMARKLEADYSVVGEVQKVSNLILTMNLVVRDAAEGQHVRGISVDIRGNTDDSWRRGMRYILKNNIFRE
jgi:hypothetical protein